MAASSLTLLLPALAPSGDLADEVLAQAQAPALQRLLRGARRVAQDTVSDPWHPALPHERWLCSQFDLNATENALPLGSLLYKADFKAESAAQPWYCLQPVHIHAARDHLVLLPPEVLNLQAEESAALLATALPVLEEISAQRNFSHHSRWYVGAENLPELLTSSPERAAGRNIDTWMPRNLVEEGDADIARRWRKWQNEIQMMWFDHPVNRAREMRGALPVNSLWLYGGGVLKPSPAATVFTSLYSMDSASALLDGLAQHSGATHQVVQQIPQCAAPSLLFVNALSEAAQQEDWGAWLQILAELDATCFAPLEQALGAGQLASAQLVACGESQSQTWQLARPAGWKFWQKRSLRDVLRGLN